MCDAERRNGEIIMNVTEYGEYIKKAIAALPGGAFLTTKKDGKVNTMTIGWGSFGFEWGMPTFEAMVRESRFSKIAMDEIDEFTVTFPTGGDMKDALAYCGRVSGRDADKIADCKLEVAPSHTLDTPIVKCKGIVIECKTVLRLPMNADASSTEILGKWYANGDLHTMYFGKATDCYEI